MRDDLTHLINKTAYTILRRYRRWVEAADIRQEMWAWVYAQSAKEIDGLPEQHLRRRLKDVGLIYARKEKAVRSGYDPDDEAFYTIPMLQELLPAALDPEPAVLRGVDDRETSATRRAVAGAGMTYETAVADVRKALRGLDEVHRLALEEYVSGKLPRHGAAAFGLLALQRALGGRKPRREAA